MRNGTTRHHSYCFSTAYRGAAALFNCFPGEQCSPLLPHRNIRRIAFHTEDQCQPAECDDIAVEQKDPLFDGLSVNICAGGRARVCYIPALFLLRNHCVQSGNSRIIKNNVAGFAAANRVLTVFERKDIAVRGVLQINTGCVFDRFPQERKKAPTQNEYAQNGQNDSADLRDGYHIADPSRTFHSAFILIIILSAKGNVNKSREQSAARGEGRPKTQNKRLKAGTNDGKTNLCCNKHQKVTMFVYKTTKI